MDSNVHNSTSLLRLSKIIRHSDIWLALGTDLCVLLFDLFYCTLCYYKNLIKTLLLDKFEVCFCDVLLSVETFSKK